MSVQLMAFGCFMSLERLQDMRHPKVVNWMDIDNLRTSCGCRKDDACLRAHWEETVDAPKRLSSYCMGAFKFKSEDNYLGITNYKQSLSLIYIV